MEKTGEARLYRIGLRFRRVSIWSAEASRYLTLLHLYFLVHAPYCWKDFCSPVSCKSLQKQTCLSEHLIDWAWNAENVWKLKYTFKIFLHLF